MNTQLRPQGGFFEWQAGSAGKTPYYITMADGEPFAFGGFIEHWRPSKDAEPTVTFCILTTEPNALCATLHDRMPAIVDPRDYARWLDPTVIEPAEIAPMIKPYPSQLMSAYPVSRRVNNVRNDDAGVLEPAA